RWWDYPYGEDSEPIPGLPGDPGAQTSAGGVGSLEHPATLIPLGSYPDAQTPWSLLDASGGASEWTEEWNGFYARTVDGSRASNSSVDLDVIWSVSASSVDGSGGLRVASAVPGPGCGIVLAALVFIQSR